MGLIIWRFLDGNRAHEKQSAALVRGIQDITGPAELECFNIPCGQVRLWRQRPGELEELPRPDFIIGAGHRSHWPMLLARRQFGGRCVVIMKPSLPIGWFDFALIPDHDCPPPLPNIIPIQGALAEPLPGVEQRRGRGLLLLGGPSKHFAWDRASVLRSVETLFEAPLEWIVSDSRRTPVGVLDQLRGLGPASTEFRRWQDCPPGWLAGQMAAAGQIWVTGDSISMVYEALQSSARVGVIALPSRRTANKVRAAIQRLIDREVVTDRIGDVHLSFGDGRQPLDQYLQCAGVLLRRSGMGRVQEVETP